jgi:hypothetical protein
MKFFSYKYFQSSFKSTNSLKNIYFSEKLLMKISQKQNNIPKIFLIEVEICSKANIL